MSPREAARQALLVTGAVYLGFALVRLLSPAVAGVALVGAFYFLPGWLYRKQPDWAREDELGVETTLPPWRPSGWKTAALACAIIFPPFVLFVLWFYTQVCGGELGLVRPILWLEDLTPWSGSLEGFWGRQCRGYGGEFFPQTFRLPKAWAAYALQSDAWGMGRWPGALFGGALDAAIGLLVVALPEEVFHRGYLMGALDRAWPPKRKVLGVALGWGAVISSVLFALGHLVAYAEPSRLATFVPALVFAWLWRRSGSLWAPALFHFASNFLMVVLLASLFGA